MMRHELLSPINVKWQLLPEQMQPSTKKVLPKWSDDFRQLKRSREKVARKWFTPMTIHRFLGDVIVQLEDPVIGLPVRKAHVTQLKTCLKQVEAAPQQPWRPKAKAKHLIRQHAKCVRKVSRSVRT
uniref:Uncharacterized protein n=1 Tax=Timema poppense TaxID=170557 RepID=A0A7R9HGH5_TIMPO|nr:unnamed protein product [Timema poppensis]